MLWKCEMRNLPFLDSPDVFADACELMESNLEYVKLQHRSRVGGAGVNARDPLNVFRSWRFIFHEPLDLHRINRRGSSSSGSNSSDDIEQSGMTTTSGVGSNSSMSDAEDAFCEWWAAQTDVISDTRVNRKWQNRGRRKLRSCAGTPTAESTGGKRESNQHRWEMHRPGSDHIKCIDRK